MASNNENELTERRRQGGAMAAAKWEFAKYATSTGACTAALIRQNHANAVKGGKLWIVSTCNCVRSNSTLGTVHSQQRSFLLARYINPRPRKLLISHLTQFIAEAIESRREVILTADTNDHVV